MENALLYSSIWWYTEIPINYVMARRVDIINSEVVLTIPSDDRWW